MTLGAAALLSGLAGFIALSYEIVWFRVFAYVSTDSPTAFGFLLGAYLAGIAVGSLLAKRFCPPQQFANNRRVLVALGGFVAAANVAGYLVVPLAAWMVTWAAWAWALLLVMVAAAGLGAVLPLLAHVAIPPNNQAGARLSYIYVANILGSTAGSLVTGFVAMDALGLSEIHLALLCVGLLMAVSVVGFAAPRGAIAAVLAGVVVLAALSIAHGSLFDRLFERLQWQTTDDGERRFVWILENRHGVIAVDHEDKVYGGGAYDGATNVYLRDDKNWVFRAYALGAVHPAPRRVLMVGLASGSWAQVVAHLPGVEELVVVEINPGYLELIAREPQVASLLTNPKVRIEIDDGRRWMRRHPGERFDAIVQNTTWHFRAHATNLLSQEYLQLTRNLLAPGGVLILNTTSSADAMLTAMHVFPHGLRMFNCMVMGESPVVFDAFRWEQTLRDVRIDGEPPLHPGSVGDARVLQRLLALPASIQGPPDYEALESLESLRARLRGAEIITDDNMLTEFLWLRE